MDAPDVTRAWGFHPGSRDLNRSRGHPMWRGVVTPLQLVLSSPDRSHSGPAIGERRTHCGPSTLLLWLDHSWARIFDHFQGRVPVTILPSLGSALSWRVNPPFEFHRVLLRFRGAGGIAGVETKERNR